MKKQILVFFTTVCLIMMSGCSSTSIDEKTLEVYKDAVEKTKDTTSANYTMKILVDSENLEAGDVRGKIDFSGSYVLKDEQPQISSTVTFSVNGIKMSEMMKLHFFDNIMYIDMMGSKVKQPIQTEDDEASAKSIIDIHSDGIKEYLKECNMETIDDKQVLHFVMNDTFINTIVDSSFDSLLSEYTKEEIEEIKKTFTSVNMNLTVDEKGRFHTYEFQALMEKNEMKIEMSIQIDVSDINEVIEIPMPDVDEYTESDNFGNELEDFATGGGKLPSDSNYYDYGGENL